MWCRNGQAQKEGWGDRRAAARQTGVERVPGVLAEAGFKSRREGYGRPRVHRAKGARTHEVSGSPMAVAGIGFGLPNVPFELIQRLSTNNRGLPGAPRSLSPNPGSLSIVPHVFLRWSSTFRPQRHPNVIRRVSSLALN